MVGTYKWNGKEVSEVEFKEKRYGSDSKAAQSARKRIEEKKRDVARAGSKGSSYTKVTRKDGSQEIKSKYSGKTIKELSAKEVAEKKAAEKKAKREAKKGNLVVDEKGRALKSEDYLVEQQKAFSDENRARLTVGKGGRVEQQANVVYAKNIRQKDFPKTKDETQEQYEKRLQKISDYFGEREVNRLAKKKEKKGEGGSVTLKLGVETKKQEPSNVKLKDSVSTSQNKKQKTASFIPVISAPSPSKSGDDWLSRQYDKLSFAERKALERQEKREAEGKSTFTNIAVLPLIAAGKAAVNLGKLGKSTVQTLRIGGDNYPDYLKVQERGREIIEDVKEEPSTLYKKPKEGVTSFLTSTGENVKSNPLGVATELGAGYAFMKLAGAGTKAGVRAFKKPKITSQGIGQTRSTNLADDVVKSTSKQSIKIKSGTKQYQVDSTTRIIDRADDAGVRLQSGKTDLKISQLDKKGVVKSSNTGFARSEGVSTTTKEGVVLGRADTVQATNVGTKSFVRQGDFVSAGRSYGSDRTVSSIVKTSKAAKSKLVSSADDLKFSTAKTKKVSGVESTASKKVAEVKAPETMSYNTPYGNVKITSKEKFTNTVFDDVTSARSGRYLSKADRAANVKVDPYSQTISSKGVSVSSQTDDVASALYKSSKKMPKPKPTVSNTNIVPSGSSLMKTVTKKVGPTPLSAPSTQAVSAVKDVVEPQIAKTSTVIDTVSKSAGAVAGASVAVAEPDKLESEQKQLTKKKEKESEVQDTKQMKPVSRPIFREKIFTSSKQSSKQNEGSKQASGLKNRNVGRSKTKTFTDSIVSEKVTQEKTMMPMTKTTTTTKPMMQTKPRPVSNRPSRVVPPFVPNKSAPSSQRQPVGFAVFTRERGVFKRVGSSSYAKKDAMDLGAFTVGTTPRATFTLRPSASPVSNIKSSKKGYFDRIKSNLRSKGGLFIEKKEKRITTKGEKAGITMKGILANKNKNTFKGLKL